MCTHYNNKNTWCLYIHENIYNNKKYIGITSNDPEKRWKNGNGYSYNPYFFNAINKYGWDSFTHNVVLTGMTIEEASKKEQEYIKLYNTTDDRFGYNLTDGGEGSYGRKVSEETKEKIRNAHIGKKHTEESKQKISEALIGNKYALGMRHTEETKRLIGEKSKGNQHAKGNHLSEEARKKISEANKGKPKSEETRKKLSDANKGKVISEETRRKISEKNKGQVSPMKGKHHSNETKKKMSESKKRYFAEHPEAIENTRKRNIIPVDMYSMDGIFIRSFESIAEANRETGIDNSSIVRVCKGQAPHAGFFKWRYHDTN